MLYWELSHQDRWRNGKDTAGGQGPVYTGTHPVPIGRSGKKALQQPGRAATLCSPSSSCWSLSSSPRHDQLNLCSLVRQWEKLVYSFIHLTAEASWVEKP